MKLFDLHCDTAGELYRRGLDLASADLMVSLDRAECFSPYVQLAAFWSDKDRSNAECRREFYAAHAYFREQTEGSGARCALCESYTELQAALSGGKAAFIAAIEGLRLADGDLSEIERLRKTGVRFATLTWAGQDCIGGAHDTDIPLTDFGREALDECFRLGIVPDVSHLSHSGIAEVLDSARRSGKPVLATHSDPMAITPIGRNLADSEAAAIAELGGIVGISLYPPHLSPSGSADISDAVRAISHFINVAGEEAVALGCDFDGIDLTPRGIGNISELPSLCHAMVKDGISPRVCELVFFENAMRFARENL